MGSVRSGHLFMQVYLRVQSSGPCFFWHTLTTLSKMSGRMHDSLQMTPPYLRIQSYMKKVAASQLNSDLEIISQWAY